MVKGAVPGSRHPPQDQSFHQKLDRNAPPVGAGLGEAAEEIVRHELGDIHLGSVCIGVEEVSIGIQNWV